MSLSVVGKGWCARCGQPYESPTKPTCECAGEPPATRSNLDPDRRAYFRRVRNLHYQPAVQS